ncbi:MAG: DUF5106 domain-containing protein [Rikenellaceae bacterium]
MERNSFVKVYCWFIAALLMGCGNSVAAPPSKSAAFTLPEIPSAIANINSRREYLALHYWDNFDFENINLIKNDSLRSIAVGGYIQVLLMNPPVVVEKSIDVSLSSALKSGYDQFEHITSTLEEYLYNPNSPMRNEELYIYILRYTVEKAQIDDIYKIRSKNQLSMVLKNRIGEVANDFRCEDIEGKIYTLSQIKTPYTILFFNTPDCGDCARVKAYIGSSTYLTEMVRTGKLTILAIYTEKDMEIWRNASYPSIILNTADTQGEISKNRLYDLKALPTLYLLDSNKTILLKDRSIEEIDRYLNLK